ncbi:MAG: hypothetical protein Q7S09_03930 [bacterium]|nr:hypothetical protein [bacterium]
MSTDVQKQFHKFLGVTGTIEGGDDVPVQLTSLSSSWNCITERAEKFGCKPGEQALLVEWIPMGMQFTKPGPEELPKEAGVDKTKIPPRDQWVVFPRSFGGLPVYYRRGQMAFAL